MGSIIDTTRTDRRAILSTLWIFVLLNVIFRDIHELFRPGFLEEIISGTINGNQMSEGFLLAAGIILEITIAMVILSRVLNYRVNRWANIIAGALTILFTVAAGPSDLDDLFFAAVEILALAIIIVIAWKWPKQEALS